MAKQTERVTTTAEQITGVKCDRCGKDMLRNFGTEKVPALAPEGASFVLSFGYGSRYDDEFREYDLCDDCSEAFDAWTKKAP